MTALNRINAKAPMICVYLENAHDISCYYPVLYYKGGSFDGLVKEIKEFLRVPTNREVRCELYDRRIGITNRTLLKTLPSGCEEVYVVLKVEDGNQ